MIMSLFSRLCQHFEMSNFDQNRVGFRVLFLDSCINVYLYSCLHILSIERKFMFKSGDSRAV